MMGRPRTQKKRDYVGVLSSVFAIIIGLLVGFVILLLSNPSQAVPGFITILTGALTHGLKGVGQVFYYATPIILTGLSVGFAFKTGLFNIGTPGQFIVGAFAAVYVGHHVEGAGTRPLGGGPSGSGPWGCALGHGSGPFKGIL